MTESGNPLAGKPIVGGLDCLYLDVNLTILNPLSATAGGAR